MASGRVEARQCEIAEDALAFFHEARSALKRVRSPFGYVGEGKTRKLSEHETEESRDARLDAEFVPIERLNKEAEVFENMFSLSSRVRIFFGDEAHAAFMTPLEVRHQIVVAADVLRYYATDRPDSNESR